MRARIFCSGVLAGMWLATAQAFPCSAVVNTPTETVAHRCTTSEDYMTIVYKTLPEPFRLPEMFVADDKPVYQYDTPRSVKPKVKKKRVKKKCWYRTKKGKKRYRMRYAC